MKGGKVLGTGGYGCVISPPINCDPKSKKKIGISKLLIKKKNTAKKIKREVDASNYILSNKKKGFNPNTYFCLINETCNVNINNLKSRKDYDEILKFSNEFETEKIMTLNQTNCGIDMFYPEKLPTQKKLYNVLKDPVILHKNVKNLLTALKHMKSLELVHLDIKPENLMIKNNLIKIIDFGGCIIVKNKKRKVLSDFTFTPDYFPVEAAYVTACNIYEDKLKRYSYTYNLKYPRTEKQENLINTIVAFLEKNNSIIKNYHKGNDALIYKIDIYSLGRTLYEVCLQLKIRNKKLYDLLNNMVNDNFIERYNIEQCLSHPYIKNKPKTKAKPKTTTKPKTKAKPKTTAKAKLKTKAKTLGKPKNKPKAKK